MAEQQLPNFRELFTQQVQLPEEELELDRAALYLAGEDYPSLDVAANLDRLSVMASEVRQTVGSIADQRALIEALRAHLFDHLGFDGNSVDYYSPDNSFLNRVLETRTGIPITLSLVYMEVGRRLGITCHGVGLPGHFVVGLDQLGLYLDPFNAGHLLSAADCRLFLQDTFGERLPWRQEFLLSSSKHDILFRMLTNLRQIFLQREEYARALAVVQRMALVRPAMHVLHKDISWCHLQLKEYRRAIDELETYLQREGNPHDAAEVRRQIQALWAMLSQLN